MLSDRQIKAAVMPLNYAAREKLLRIHQNIQKRAFFPTFCEKVDYINSALSSYTDIVKNPMSFTLLRQNLTTLKYFFMIEYLRDAVLMYSNCTNFVKESGAVSIQEVADEMIQCLLSQIVTAFNLNMETQELLDLGADEHFRCCSVFEYDVDITALKQSIENLNSQDQSVLLRKYEEAVSAFSLDEMRELEKEVMRKVLERD